MRTASINSFYRFCAAFFLVIMIGGCAPIIKTHGYLPPDEDLEKIVIGVDDKISVEEILGRPQNLGIASDNGWYYMSSRRRFYTYQEPEIISRDILALSFDEDDILSNVERLTLEDGRVVSLTRRVTDTPIRGPRFWEQVIGNFGNVDASRFF